MDPKVIKHGDSCPRCGGSFKAVRVATDADHARAFDRDNPVGLPENTDTANAEFRAEHGELFRCTSCGYQTRFKAEPAAAPAPATS